MPKRIVIPDHLVLPFGTKRTKGRAIKDLSAITLSAVAANGIYLQSEIPVVHIDTRQKQALRLTDFHQVFDDVGYDATIDDKDIPRSLDFIQSAILSYIVSPTTYETKFIEFYFQNLAEESKQTPGDSPFALESPMCVFNALLPIPEMQIFVKDPLSERYEFEPKNNFRVDYGFWTGKRIVAIEIDGGEPEGYAKDVRRDRMLRRANVDVIHILNMEIHKHGERVITSLLPSEFLYDWHKLPPPRWNPVAILF